MQILEPRHNPHLHGHAAAIAAFMQAAQTRLHHAWLISGPRGIGKTTFAYHCANHLLSAGRQTIGALAAQDQTFKLIASGAHADLITVAAPVDEKTGIQKDEIPVTQVRALTAFFQKTSGHDGWRIAIIRGTDRLNRNAANALLKILEEPPNRGILLMTAEAPGKLLPTIRSRCRPLAMQPLGSEDMAEILRAYADELSAEDLRQLNRLSGGSPGYALSLIQNNGLALYRDFLALLQTPRREQSSAILRFAGAGGKQESERFDLIARFCREWLQRVVHLAATGETHEILSGEGQLLRRMAAIRPLEAWFGLADRCETQFSIATQANLDKRLVLINNLQQILPAA